MQTKKMKFKTWTKLERKLLKQDRLDWGPKTNTTVQKFEKQNKNAVKFTSLNLKFRGIYNLANAGKLNVPC